MSSITKSLEAKLQSPKVIDKLKRVIRAKLRRGKTFQSVSEWLDRENRRLGEPYLDAQLEMWVQEIDGELNPIKGVIVTPRELYNEARKRAYQARRAYKAELERTAIVGDPATGRKLHPGDPDHPASKQTIKQTSKKSSARPRVYLSRDMQDLLARLRREGEYGLLTITQNIANMLALLPPQEAKAYIYMRALMCSTATTPGASTSRTRSWGRISRSLSPPRSASPGIFASGSSSS
jgi:hypothetical protein